MHYPRLWSVTGALKYRKAFAGKFKPSCTTTKMIFSVIREL